MDTGSIIALAGLGLTILGMVYQFGQMAQKLKGLEDAVEELDHHNTKQHEELYASRNDTGKALERLTALFESMKEKQESMDTKLDILIGRRSNDQR